MSTGGLVTRNGFVGFFYGKNGAKKNWHIVTTSGDDNGTRSLSI